MERGHHLSTSFILVYLLSSGLWQEDSYCATHWRLEDGHVRVVEDRDFWEKDPLFRIITLANQDEHERDFNPPPAEAESIVEQTAVGHMALSAFEHFKDSPLHCGEFVNKSVVDHLPGVSKRYEHPRYPETDVVILFRKNEFDALPMDTIEKNLIQAVTSGENKLILFNLVGNFLRIRGDTFHAIECFRGALTIDSHNTDVLLNLARILINLAYNKDALWLVKHSLKDKKPDQKPWLQHFMLGRIYLTLNELEKAAKHFKISLEHNPAFQPTVHHLKNLQHINQDSPYGWYTVIVVTVLCITILPYLYYAVIKDVSEPNNNYNYKRVGFFKRKSNS